MKKKRVYLILLLLFAFLVLVIASIPRVSSHETVSFNTVTEEKYPELFWKYQQLLDDWSEGEVAPCDEMEIVTVTSLWGSCEYYILPCYMIDVPTVPHAGQTTWSARLHIVSACSNENSLTARMCNWELRDMELRLLPGKNAFISSRVQIDPLGIVYDTWGEGSMEFEETIDCMENPEIKISYLAATGMGAEERDEPSTATFIWEYSLYCCGRQIRSYQDVTLAQDYILNA